MFLGAFETFCIVTTLCLGMIYLQSDKADPNTNSKADSAYQQPADLQGW